jgi:hypothetical protein
VQKAYCKPNTLPPSLFVGTKITTDMPMDNQRYVPSLSCNGANMKSILTLLTASFILLSSSFTLSSCKACNKNKEPDIPINRGSGAGGGSGSSSGDNGRATDDSTKPPPLTEAQEKLAVYVKEQLGNAEAARTQFIFNCNPINTEQLGNAEAARTQAEMLVKDVETWGGREDGKANTESQKDVG